VSCPKSRARDGHVSSRIRATGIVGKALDDRDESVQEAADGSSSLRLSASSKISAVTGDDPCVM
jgi:hypothetical protein